MNIAYDHNLKVAGIGMAPWTRLGLERWLPNYQIISCEFDTSVRLPGMPPLHMIDPTQLDKKNTQRMILTDEFKQMAAKELAGYRFVTYKPVEVGDLELQDRFAINDPNYTVTYENKAWLRRQFGDSVAFAPFRIYNRSELDDTQGCYEKLTNDGRARVLQHEQLSGGKGTYVVKNYDAYVKALQNLPEDGEIVVSEFVEGGRERSVQCTTTNQGIVYGGPQKQIVRAPLLCNTGLPVVQAFCGGEIGTVSPTDAQKRAIERSVQAIGNRLQADGYRGIFGIDFMFTDTEAYALEVNARLTGLTPLLTALYVDGKDIPFYLIHTLELLGEAYDIEGIPQSGAQASQPGGMMLLQSQLAGPARIEKTVASGVYGFENGNLMFKRADTKFRETDAKGDILVQQYVPHGIVVRPGSRICAVVTRQPVLAADDTLTDWAQAVVRSLYGELVLASV